MRAIDLVDPFHAVDGGGNCLPGPSVPFGMIRPGPDTANQNTSGYASGEELTGISHTHVAGTGGAGRYGNIRLMPMVQRPDARCATFAHGDETARPGYYATTARPRQGFGELANRGGVRIEVTASARCAVHRWTWDDGTEPWFRLDLGAAIGGQATGGWARWLDDRTLLCRTDLRGGWGHEVPWSVHARIVFDQPMQQTFAYGPHQMGRDGGRDWQGPGIAVCARFATRRVEARVGISFTSQAQAQCNLAEVAGRSFEAVASAAAEAWQAILDRAQVAGGSDRDRQLWNTLLMRLFTMPGDHGIDEVPWFAARRRHFNDLYCLWDSVRCANSLFTLLDPGFAADLCGCLTEIGEQTGWIPDAWIVGGSAQIQGGCSAAVLFAEAAAKRLPGFDAQAALAALRRTQETPSPDPAKLGRFPGYAERGFLDTTVKNCASRTVEYAFHDHCTAALARAVGDAGYAETCARRSARLWESWHDEHRCFAPRRADGSWDAFDPWKPSCRDFWNDLHFYEGTAQDYAITVWHAIDELARRHGGGDGFAAHLDRHRERMWHWKEINLHLPWLYHYAGQPHRGTAALRAAMDAKLTPGRRGMGDNEDMGAWSSWWITGAMGLCPVPGTARWLIGAPRFDEVRLQPPGMARPLTIRTRGLPAGSGVVTMVTFNGVAVEQSWLDHGAITHGGDLVITLGEQPTGWGSRPPPCG